jgi:hypothetical protein
MQVTQQVDNTRPSYSTQVGYGSVSLVSSEWKDEIISVSSVQTTHGLHQREGVISTQAIFFNYAAHTHCCLLEVACRPGYSSALFVVQVITLLGRALDP